MTILLAFVGGLMLGVALGFGLCAVFTAGGRP